MSPKYWANRTDRDNPACMLNLFPGTLLSISSHNTRPRHATDMTQTIKPIINGLEKFPSVIWAEWTCSLANWIPPLWHQQNPCWHWYWVLVVLASSLSSRWSKPDPSSIVSIVGCCSCGWQSSLSDDSTCWCFIVPDAATCRGEDSFSMTVMTYTINFD